MSRPGRKPSLILQEEHDPGHIDYTGWFHRQEEDDDYEIIQQQLLEQNDFFEINSIPGLDWNSMRQIFQSDNTSTVESSQDVEIIQDFDIESVVESDLQECENRDILDDDCDDYFDYMIPFLNHFTAYTELIGKLPEEEGIRHIAIPIRNAMQIMDTYPESQAAEQIDRASQNPWPSATYPRLIPNWRQQVLQLKYKADQFNPIDEAQVKIYTVTWNMAGKNPKTTLENFLNPQIPHHIYAISTQECLKSIKFSLVCEDKSEWVSMIQNTLGENYYLVADQVLGPTHLAVFARNELQSFITDIEKSTVCTGIANLVKNKGGVGIGFKIREKPILFIGCHLTASQHNDRKRAYDFNRINKKLDIFRQISNKSASSKRAAAAIWAGDMNFRIDGPKNIVEYLIDNNFADILRRSDQLFQQRLQKNISSKFKEGQLNFLPTYKFDIGTNNYDSSVKQRVPSWTDRILYQSKNKCLKLSNYISLMDWKYSDHKPVVAQFKLDISS